MRAVILFLIRGYQTVVSPWLPATCRFEPSCSEYARVAVTEHGAWRGTLLTVRRLGRCHPLGAHGYDPVPPVPPVTRAAAGSGASGHGADTDAALRHGRAG